jgi:hypothetical protein
MYDIPALLKRHRACLADMTRHFKLFFKEEGYPTNKKKIKILRITSRASLKQVHSGPGFYLIATDLDIDSNPCKLSVKKCGVVYRGHSYGVKERIESHLFYDSYLVKDSGRRFTVCVKLDGKNINIDKAPLNKNKWFAVTHSMPKSNTLIREAAEAAFDKVFGRPIGSDK